MGSLLCQKKIIAKLELCTPAEIAFKNEGKKPKKKHVYTNKYRETLPSGKF